MLNHTCPSIISDSLPLTLRLLDRSFAFENIHIPRHFHGHDVAKSLVLLARKEGVTLFFTEHEILMLDAYAFFRQEKISTSCDAVTKWIYNIDRPLQKQNKTFFETNIPPDWVRSLQEKGKWNLNWIPYYKEHGKIPLD